MPLLPDRWQRITDIVETAFAKYQEPDACSTCIIAQIINSIIYDGVYRDHASVLRSPADEAMFRVVAMMDLLLRRMAAEGGHEKSIAFLDEMFPPDRDYRDDIV